MISSREANILDGVDAWAGYYRANPHRFAKDYLNVNLRLFQKILLFMMNVLSAVKFGVTKCSWKSRHCNHSVRLHGNVFEKRPFEMLGTPKASDTTT